MSHATWIFSETSPNAAGTAASSQAVENQASYLSNGVAGPLDDYDALWVQADLVGATGGTLDVYVQSSPDDGRTWYDVVHFTQLAAGAAAISYRATLSLQSAMTAPDTVGKNTSPALAAGKVSQGAFGDRLRLLMVAGASTSAGAAVHVAVTARRTGVPASQGG